ncbi:MAG TPA: F0F1 ATP synthase subunit B [Acidimicrobiales bacterium]|jgi:F-type H+-transporting ATPase subunit b|nr:F0F1 ATP synthase subunit B [Acidimicrobiales bacterium]
MPAGTNPQLALHTAHTMTTASIFLIPNGTFIAEVVAFLIMIAFIAKYVVPPVRGAMQKREEQIRTSIESAEQARKSAEEAAAKRREALEGARQEARTIIEQANETADQLRDEGRRRGQEEYERMLESARHEIDLERERARAEVMADLGALVIDAAERVIGSGGLDAERHRALVDEAISAAQATSTNRVDGGH